MAFGCFVDIYQQDGTPQRMHYDKLDMETVAMVKWVGVMEETANEFRAATVKSTRESGNG